MTPPPKPEGSSLNAVPVPDDAAGVIVFGGSFDPPHRWHDAVARAALRHCFGGRGWVLLVPAARSPHKEGPPAASDSDRIAMARLLAKDLERASVWTDEIDRASGMGGPSYTIDTLERMRGSGPAMPRRLLIGADQAAAFHRWRRFREVLTLAEPLVALRPPIQNIAALRGALAAVGVWSDGEVDEWIARVLPAAVSPESSTRVRAEIARGGNADEWLTPGVASYIRERGLYRGDA